MTRDVTTLVRTRALVLLAGLALACAAPARADLPVDPAPAAPGVTTADAAADSLAPPDPELPAAEAATPPTEADEAAAPASTSPNPRITVIRKVRLIDKTPSVVRSGPGDRFAIVSVVQGKQTFPIIAKSEAWYNVRLSETETGWIHSSLVEEFEDLSGLEFRPNPKLYSRTGSYILTGYTGAYAFDRKSNSLVVGGRLGYYVFDRIQVEGGAAWTHVKRPAEIVESLFGLSLEAEEFHMLFYHLVVTWEILPGRQMVPYASAGVGSSIMRGDTETSFDFGAGTTLFLSKRTAMRWEVRDYRFDSGPQSSRRTNHNIEFTLGTAVLF